MRLFTSARERRLWLWILAIMLAIYSTLGQTRLVVTFLRDRSLLTPVFFLGLFLVVGAIALQGMRARPGRAEIWVALAIAAAYLLAWARLQIAEERGHLIEYSLVATLIYQALIERQNNGRHVPSPALLAFAVTALLGWLDEGIQALLPNRVYDLRDVAFNVIAAGMAIVASLALAWARRRWGN